VPAFSAGASLYRAVWLVTLLVPDTSPISDVVPMMAMTGLWNRGQPRRPRRPRRQQAGRREPARHGPVRIQAAIRCPSPRALIRAREEGLIDGGRGGTSRGRLCAGQGHPAERRPPAGCANNPDQVMRSHLIARHARRVLPGEGARPGWVPSGSQPPAISY
jgi:hypothetical protein